MPHIAPRSRLYSGQPQQPLTHTLHDAIDTSMSYPDEKNESKGELHHEEVVDERLLSEQALIESAMLRGEEETKLGFKGVIKLHYKAALWSMALS